MSDLEFLGLAICIGLILNGALRYSASTYIPSSLTLRHDWSWGNKIKLEIEVTHKLDDDALRIFKMMSARIAAK